MRATDVQSREEELNERRKAEQESAEQDNSVVGAVSKTADMLVKPLIRPKTDPEDLQKQREENDREQRPDEG